MLLKRDQVINDLTKNKAILQRYGVTRLGLFGSLARDEAREDSDIDVLVDFENKSFDAYMDTKAFLEKLFQHKVDLVLSDALKSRIKHAILSEAVYVPGL